MHGSSECSFTVKCVYVYTEREREREREREERERESTVWTDGWIDRE
jgi:hypothetical protein